MRAGHEAEALAFGELTMTPQSAALRHLFFATTAMKKSAAPLRSRCRYVRLACWAAG